MGEASDYGVPSELIGFFDAAEDGERVMGVSGGGEGEESASGDGVSG